MGIASVSQAVHQINVELQCYITSNFRKSLIVLLQCLKKHIDLKKEEFDVS